MPAPRTPRSLDQVLFAFLKADERGLRICDVANLLNMSLPAARTAVRTLEDRGRLVRHSHILGTHWAAPQPRI